MVRVARGQHFAVFEPGLAGSNRQASDLASIEVEMSLAEFAARSQQWYPFLQAARIAGPALLGEYMYIKYVYISKMNMCGAEGTYFVLSR